MMDYSKNCGVGQVPREMTPSVLDEEEDSGSEISWEAALMDYGCGLVIGFFIVLYFAINSESNMVFQDD
ncbi:hypothetical protein RND71_014163 [Anisodus tanguticus]|uniref:Uncharacterized protein n=1 Tax=Anisodus tanguticus TaxID=243964 RepID=A0AAE1S9B5_9SOLA|nr:hypothetical protein RND71_014163 [Anisodus tanguticus]